MQNQPLSNVHGAERVKGFVQCLHGRAGLQLMLYSQSFYCPLRYNIRFTHVANFTIVQPCSKRAVLCVCFYLRPAAKMKSAVTISCVCLVTARKMLLKEKKAPFARNKLTVPLTCAAPSIKVLK